MTQVRFRPRRANGADIDGVILSQSTIVAEPDRRATLDAGELLPVGLTISINGAEVTKTFPANTLPTWVWKFTEKYPDGKGGILELVSYRNIPATGTVLDYEDLTIVDPTTLNPVADPEAAWWVALEDAIIGGGGGGGGPITSSLITDSTAVGRAVITAANTAAARNAISAAAASHTHAVADIVASGTASNTTYLRGDGTWQTIIPGAANWNDLSGKPALVAVVVGAGAARPVVDVVMWIADSVPTNIATGDVWLNSSGSTVVL